ncbi:hypothetical protein [Moritella viscosa]|uniref:Response receiver domain-containing protein n=1 Tax=Moritella viscosa TaxID=80854 RepID=A0A1K9YWM5_9GAMM|nr:hypothetical protein [Moritella viscosa]SGY87502.1 Putative uncharacterized protein [Moritella viscosa]
MIKFPSIVLIDDKKEDLDTLQNSFTRSGYPCFPILYKNDDLNDTGIDHVELDKINPRVIISDLNLHELQRIDARGLVGPIAEVLKKLAIDGPYILYFWSRNANIVSEVMELIESRYSDSIPYPLHWGVLDKAQFNTRPDDLAEKVKNLFEENPMFNALFGWENRVSTAAQCTTDSLFKLARAPQNISIEDFQSQTTEKLQNMLAVIGSETIGHKNAKEEPEVAIELGLEPVLHDHIQSTYEHIDRSVWLKAAPHIGTRLNTTNEIKAHLNSFYHIEDVAEDAPKNKRGTWIELSSAYFGTSTNNSKIKQNLGKNIKEILHDEFLDPSSGSKAERAAARDATKLGFIEVSAECDQAQRKTKLHRYYLSALIPIEHSSLTYFRHGTSDIAHAGIYRLPNLIISGTEYVVKISFMYPIGAIPDINKWLGKPLFRLKDQILADISFKVSQHTSRPGIIRFD